MDFRPEQFLRHVRACTNAVFPDGRVVLRIGRSVIGWTLPEHAPCEMLTDRAGFDRYIGRLAASGVFQPRDEAFDVVDDITGAVVATVDRGAIPILGIAARGVHVNGLVRRPDGLHLWIGRRSADKRTEPGKLDHVTAGGIATGEDAWSTLVKEAEEEASLPARLVRTAQPVSTLRYAMQRDGGVRRDRLYCFDLVLPGGVLPRPNDGEVVEFMLWPLTEVMRLVAETDHVKFNVNLVLIDLFLRLGMIEAGGVVDAAFALLRMDAGPDSEPLP